MKDKICEKLSTTDTLLNWPFLLFEFTLPHCDTFPGLTDVAVFVGGTEMI